MKNIQEFFKSTLFFAEKMLTRVRVSQLFASFTCGGGGQGPEKSNWGIICVLDAYLVQSSVLKPNSFFKGISNTSLPSKTVQFILPLVIIFIIGLCLPLGAQQPSESSKCKEEPSIFTGLAEQTLCEKNPNFICDIQIGAGTPFPKSSMIGTSLTGNVCIIGDFIVDAPFMLQNALVKINPMVSIVIEGSPNGYDVGGAFSIDNSKLFACSGLWKGIKMMYLSSISTSNRSIIEDAETAIFASGLCALYINETNFNRNRVGIELNTPSQSLLFPKPLIYTFVNNTFNCDAPLNGTTNGITEVGVKIVNGYLFSFQQGVNLFTGLEYGVHVTGDFSQLGVGNFHMRRIKKDGIFMQNGLLTLTESDFIDTEDKAVNIEIAQSINISSCKFLYNADVLPEDSEKFRKGIYIQSFALNSNTQINNITFTADLLGTENRVRGIHLVGGEIGDNSKIHIGGGSIFSIRARDVSSGIYLDGEFPITSITEIWGNTFRVSNEEFAAVDLSGIYAPYGNKNNLSIKWNSFLGWKSENISNFSFGIILYKSSGENNEVSLNSFSSLIQRFNRGIEIDDFENTKFCSNTFQGAGSPLTCFALFNNNYGTDIIGNIIVGTSFPITIGENGIIGPQEHKGNKFFDYFFPSGGGFAWQYGPVWHVYQYGDPTYATYNKFTVHKQQRTCGDPNDPDCNFTEYHPSNIFPDDMNEFWDVDPTGSPVEACVNEIQEPTGSLLDNKIALGGVSAGSENTAFKWGLRKSLYHKLVKNPSLLSTANYLSSYKSIQDQSNIGIFYNVRQITKSAFSADPNVLSTAQQAMGNMAQIIDDIKVIDGQIEQEGITEDLKEAKKSLISQIYPEQLAYNTANTNYWISVKSSLQSAFSLNESILSSFIYESNEKQVTSIYLNSLINQNGAISESDIETLSAIAIQDPKEGGSAVFGAIGLLPECLRPAPIKERADFDPDLNKGRLTKLTSDSKDSGIEISPNPANKSFVITGIEVKNGLLLMFDLTGKEVLKSNLTEDSSTIDLPHDIQSGTYFLRFISSNGKEHHKKIVIHRN